MTAAEPGAPGAQAEEMGGQGVWVGSANKQMSGSTDPGQPVNRVDIPAGHGVQVGDHATRNNKYIQAYIENQFVQQSPPSAPGPIVAGEVPQPPPAFQSWEELMAVLRAGGPGVSVVQVVTGMRGVGKTQLAAAYARSRIDEGWRPVAWVNAGDMAKVLDELAAVAIRDSHD